MPENKKNPTYRELLETLKEMNESAEMFKSLVYNDLEGDGFDIKITEDFVSHVPKSYIEVASEEELEQILYELGIKDEKAIRNLCKQKYTVLKLAENPDNENIDIDAEFDDKIYSERRHALLMEIMLTVIDNINEVKDTFDEVESIKKQADEQMEEYIKYITSDEYDAKQKDRIEQLMKKAEESKNPEEKRRCLAIVKSLKDAKDFKFLQYRIDKLGEPEIRKIEDMFFNNSGSSHLMERFRNKIKKLGYDEKIYLSFLNLEEKFLEEKYHVYNNLFLFHVVRYIVHVDTYSKDQRLFATTIITNLGNLVYNRFTSDTLRTKFLNVIRDFLDRFSGSYERFDKYNVLHPNHPTRIEKQNKRTQEVKDMIYANLEHEGYNITDEVRALDLDDLRILYEGFIDELKEKKEQEEKSSINQLIDKLKLNSEAHYREKLKKKYLQYSEMTEEMNNFFETAPIEELEQKISDLENESKSWIPQDDSE